MTLDHPLIRARRVCPACDKPKEPGLEVCWPCYRKYRMRYGNRAIEDALAQIEHQMRLQAEIVRARS